MFCYFQNGSIDSPKTTVEQFLNTSLSFSTKIALYDLSSFQQLKKLLEIHYSFMTLKLFKPFLQANFSTAFTDRVPKDRKLSIPRVYSFS